MRKKRRQIDMPPSYVIEHLDEAIEKHWVRVHYQPIVRTISGQLCAMEGLARWDDPNWGFLTPPFFISILEQHNLIHKLDAFLIEEVCRNQARVRKAGLPSVPVSLNLSRLDFINCDIIISMDKRIGNRTLAEGVETQEQFEFLREIGCEKIQGYYLGRPRPYETIHNCLEKGITVELGC